MPTPGVDRATLAVRGYSARHEINTRARGIRSPRRCRVCCDVVTVATPPRRSRKLFLLALTRACSCSGTSPPLTPQPPGGKILNPYRYYTLCAYARNFARANPLRHHHVRISREYIWHLKPNAFFLYLFLFFSRYTHTHTHTNADKKNIYHFGFFFFFNILRDLAFCNRNALVMFIPRQ